MVPFFKNKLGMRRASLNGTQNPTEALNKTVFYKGDYIEIKKVLHLHHL